MSYTNSTPNLHLPLYIDTDKPSYLGDWNQAMNDIDTGYGEVGTIKENVSALETVVDNINSTQIPGINNSITSINATLTKNSNFMSSENGKRAVFVGDSFATGVGSSAAQAYPALMSKIMGWNMTNVAVGATGFVDGGTNGKTFQVQLNDAKTQLGAEAANVDYIIIAGGYNDWNDASNITYEQMVSATTTTLTTARANFINAKIILVPMLFKNSQIDTKVADLYQGILSGARASNINYEIVDGAYLWQLGIANYDGVHPDANGQITIACNILNSMFGGDVPKQQIITKTFTSGDVDIYTAFVLNGFNTTINILDVNIKNTLTAGFDYNLGAMSPRTIPNTTQRIHAFGSDGTYQGCIVFSTTLHFVPKSAWQTTANLTFGSISYFTHGGAVS